ncbi:pathogenesis-related protein 10-3.1 [Cinnamomum micranthum f. kanehirae]|uniref:Pathogenesis-related protein 10-3.1 n=1 Tax=Cinnamomum micranthum f. kanehirae TaxID=337451 RepID=A0A443P7P4_9MAGN|nr:pathogenesis-related protein 10-3.1 [Cinnamomum micranthum f. kanehirae]
MVAGSLSNEVLSPVSPSRLWMALVTDSHNLMPKLMPDIISSVVTLQVIKDFSYWKDRIDTIDEEKHVFKYTVIEGRPFREESEVYFI